MMKIDITRSIVLGLSCAILGGCESPGNPPGTSRSHGPKPQTAEQKWLQGKERRENKRKAFYHESKERSKRWWRAVTPN